jgi:hypothetical protein
MENGAGGEPPTPARRSTLHARAGQAARRPAGTQSTEPDRDTADYRHRPAVAIIRPAGDRTVKSLALATLSALFLATSGLSASAQSGKTGSHATKISAKSCSTLACPRFVLIGIGF